MKRALVLCWVVLCGLPASGAPDETEAKFRELSASLKQVKKSAQWEEIKKRRDIVVALGEIDHPGVVALLHEVFTEDREPVCRIPALIGLGRRGSFGVYKSVVTVIMREKDELYRMALPLLFAETKDEAIGPWLLRNLLPDKRDLVLRAAVVESLGLLRCAEALPAVREMAAGSTKDLRIRYEAVLALGRIGGAAAFDELLPFLEAPERHLREAAVRALAETGSPSAVEKVLPLASG
ncbi:MAG: HEAT repeat domain-containing protein [Planctomycetes bacterium]|nr:HEAT repeat domain-containing protein [Planctomycetota bacterium]